MPDHHESDSKNLLIRTVFVGLILASALVGLGAKMAHLSGDQIWNEIAKAGVQLGIITIIGGGVGFALRRVDSIREERREKSQSDLEAKRKQNEYRLSVLGDITTSYNQVKAVRRTLRALGVMALTAPLTAEQANKFFAQMKSLNEAQLSLERVKREVDVRRISFEKGDDILCALNKAENYVNEIIKNWEKEGAGVVTGAPPRVMGSFTQLQLFLEKHDKDFDEGIGDPMEKIQKLISDQTSPEFIPQ
jgi:hypothetical protein